MSVIEFERRSSNFLSCIVAVSESAYSSGVLFDEPVCASEQEIALRHALAAFSYVQSTRPAELHDDVARFLPPEADTDIFNECELVSLSAVWRHQEQSLRLSLAYGFDDGVYAVASWCDGAIDDVSIVS